MDLMGMMKQARELQDKMQSLQQEIAELSVTGHSGGGMVQVAMDGKGTVQGVKIDPSLLVPAEVEILEDLLVAAATDARTKADAIAEEKMRSVTAGLPLPAGMKLPF